MKEVTLLVTVLVVITVLCSGGFAQTIPQCADGTINVYKYVLDSEPVQMEWLTANGSNAVETFFVLTQSQSLYRSKEEGRNLLKQTGISGVRSMITTSSPSQLYFLTKNGLYTTKDSGDTYTKKTLPEGAGSAFSIEAHSTDPNAALAVASSPGCVWGAKGGCHNELYVTFDFGTTWRSVAIFVDKCVWSRSSSNIYQVIFIQYMNVTSTENQYLVPYWRRSLVSVENVKVSILPKYVADHVAQFVYKDDKIFYAGLTSPVDFSRLRLYVSLDHASSFFKAEFPVDEKLTKESRYTIADVSESIVFINVDHSVDHKSGTTYVSGPQDRHYVESLKNNKRLPTGQVDFRRVRGIEGVYFANTLDIDEANPVNTGGEVRGISHMSYDKGGRWHKIRPPTNDSFNNPINCQPNCSLHLFGPTQATYSQFYSTSKAVGLIIGTGVVGPYLLEEKDEVNTFFSRDAGQTWTEVAKGEYTFEYGDRGSIIIMAKFGDFESTTTVKYTLDEGLTWNECRVSDQELYVTNIITDPQSTARNFLVQARQEVKEDNNDNVKDEYVLIFVDFQNFRERTCRPDDYESWAPFDEVSDYASCLLGQRIVYSRKKPSAQCWNNREVDIAPTRITCDCSSDDYECDFCFEYDVFNDKCVYICENDTNSNNYKETFTPEAFCSTNATVYKTKGYRRVAGDVCKDTPGTLTKYAKTPIRCNGSNPMVDTKRAGSGLSGGAIFGIIILILMFLLILALVAIVVISRRNQDVADHLNKYLPANLSPLWDSRNGFRSKKDSGDLESGRRLGGKYEVLGTGKGNSLLDEEEDDDGLQDEPEEFGKKREEEKKEAEEKKESKTKIEDDPSFNPRSV